MINQAQDCTPVLAAPVSATKLSCARWHCVGALWHSPLPSGRRLPSFQSPAPLRTYAGTGVTPLGPDAPHGAGWRVPFKSPRLGNVSSPVPRRGDVSM
eukprot:CAMPEP_0183438220 /NCGR_PEP_ID=MMETSP0370-20130417/76748_1 /TAXON_ID=268820 /ORGANISM="Peridinium aciculiferum, Strain PAER-2" /LENGTH=97 /DNA_ID=CAMNT_0025626375 /DNA_START=33 /DNA_END=323 /DNA_ORIENTATION=-